jgi:hypothetical protein
MFHKREGTALAASWGCSSVIHMFYISSRTIDMQETNKVINSRVSATV